MLNVFQPQRDSLLLQRRRPRWSLRGMIIALAVVGVVCAIWAAWSYTPREVAYARKLQNHGYQVMLGERYGGRRYSVAQGDGIFIKKIQYGNGFDFRNTAAGNKLWKLLGSESLALMQKCQHLEEISLENSDLDSDAVLQMASLSQIHELWLPNTDVDDRLLAELALDNQVRTLNIEGTKVTEDGLKHLKDFWKLESIRVGGPKITGEFLEVVREFPYLNEIWIFPPSQLDVKNLQHLNRMKIRSFAYPGKPSEVPLELLNNLQDMTLYLYWDAPLDEEDRRVIEAFRMPGKDRWMTVRPLGRSS